MSHPLITIGMPVYNCENTVADAIASILNQSFQGWKLIVYDDGSGDSTVEIASRFRDPRICVIQGGLNQKLPTCLNKIIAGCDSEYFARMDGDDVAYPTRLEKQLEALRRDPSVDLLGGSILIFDQVGQERGLRRAAPTHAGISGPPWRISSLPHVTWMGRTEWFKRHGYNSWATHAQDRDLLTRTRKCAKFAALTEVLVGVREAAPLWKKLYRSRWQMIKTTLTEGIRQREMGLLVISSLVEVMKLGLDAFAIATGLNYKVLKYRIPTVPPEEAAQWRSVLESTRARVQLECGNQS